MRAVARHYHNAVERHWKAVIKYYGIPLRNQGVRTDVCAGSGLDLTAYSDADYADESNDRRSVSGVVVALGGAAVSWASSTQRCDSVDNRGRVRRRT